MLRNKNQQGFFTLMTLLLIVLLAAIVIAYLRVHHAQK